MTQKEIESHARRQLALDMNCRPDDFDHEGIVFCPVADTPGRRPFPRGESHFEMLTTGRAVVVCASEDLLPYLRRELAGKTRDEAFNMPFVVGQGLYYLPELAAQPALPAPKGVSLRLVEKPQIPALYGLKGFGNAVQYDVNHPRPDVLVALAEEAGEVAGMAGASADCEMLWQIGIDVLPPYRGRGIAAALVAALAAVVLARGKVPYYGTSTSNIASQRVARRAGFAPAWGMVWRGRFAGALTAPAG